MSLAVGQGIEFGALKISRHQFVELLLVVRWIVFLADGYTLGVLDILQNLSAKRTFANRLQTVTEQMVILVGQYLAELALEAFQVAKHELINDGNKSIEFKDGVLQRCGCQQDLLALQQGFLDGVGNAVGGLIDIAQTMRLVNNHQVPCRVTEISGLGTSKLIRTNDNTLSVKRVQDACFYVLVKALLFQNAGWQEELIHHFC